MILNLFSSFRQRRIKSTAPVALFSYVPYLTGGPYIQRAKMGKGASGAWSRKSGVPKGRGEASQPRAKASTLREEGGGGGAACAAFWLAVVSCANFGGVRREGVGGGGYIVRL